MENELNIPEAIMNAVNSVLKSDPQYADPKDCKDCCVMASVQLRDALYKSGIKSTLTGEPGHAWVLTDDGFNIDLTARQFDALEPCPKIWKTINVPEPIMNVINSILKSNPEYSHPDDSWGCCRRASVELQDALSKIGIQSTRAYSPGHTWILTEDGLNIDLTARQFGASEPCPKIWKSTLTPITMKNDKEKADDFLNGNLTIESLLVLTMADIDISLLQNKEQTADKEGVYTKEQIREQLENSAAKMCTTLKKLGIDINKELKSSVLNHHLN